MPINLNAENKNVLFVSSHPPMPNMSSRSRGKPESSSPSRLVVSRTRHQANKLSLKSIVDDMESLLQNTISNLATTNQAIKDTTYVPFSLVDIPSSTRSGKEVDQWLQNKLSPDLSLKECKKSYIECLKKLANNLEAEERKGLALYILNSPDHFLKKERHFFRSQTHSNDTFSVHELVNTLMQVEQQNGKITIHDEEYKKDHVIPRHVK
ncbi:hypothetical protein [Legionella brunensis]|uniref:Uncharacterized protein n=1 Tax=Legionella brunensis TaxID=29422 RepID=A0A0W0STR7_9GAMM|nr:hypothetical protein [Legionella brunensis]KTC86770.1 hypothetical protein Lbru_0711 [Legionella brunensis]